MADRNATPSADDDLETSEQKSKSVDERVVAPQDPDLVPEIVLPGTVAANVPQGGVGREGRLDKGTHGAGEIALDRERRAQQTPIQRG